MTSRGSFFFATFYFFFAGARGLGCFCSRASRFRLGPATPFNRPRPISPSHVFAIPSALTVRVQMFGVSAAFGSHGGAAGRAPRPRARRRPCTIGLVSPQMCDKPQVMWAMAEPGRAAQSVWPRGEGTARHDDTADKLRLPALCPPAEGGERRPRGRFPLHALAQRELIVVAFRIEL